MLKGFLIILVKLILLFSTIVSHAAIITVNFSGNTSSDGVNQTVTGGFSGYFIYDDTDILNDIDGVMYSDTGLDVEVYLNYDDAAASGLFETGTASLYGLEYGGGVLTRWILGGDLNGGSFVPLSGIDFVLVNDGTPSLIEYSNQPGSFIELRDVQYSITAVPLPASFYLLGSGLIFVAGTARRLVK